MSIFKRIRPLALLMLPIICGLLLSGCGTCNNIWGCFTNTKSDETAVNNDRYYYRDSYNGRYYYRDNLGKYHSQHGYQGNDQYSNINGFYIDNSPLATQVRAALHADSALSRQTIYVKNFEGRIELSGSVTSAEKDQALKIARDVPGVKLVIDAFTVNLF